MSQHATLPAQTRPADQVALPGMHDQDFRRLGHEAVEIAADYLSGIRDEPVFRVMPDSVRATLIGQPLGDEGVPAGQLLHEVRDTILPYPMGNGHPRFFGWVNSPPAPVGVIAELLAAAQDPSCDVGDIASLHVETAVLGWFKQLMGFPDAAAGILVSGGTMASLTGLAAARQWVAETDGWDVRRDGVQPPDGRRLLVYASQEVHSSIRKSVELLGIGSGAIRQVAVDRDYRLDVADLVEQLEADLAAGARPFCVVASAGTTNTGAVDPLAELAELCQRYRLWLHVDGAYGAIASLHPDRAELMAGLRQANSLTLDPHKWLSVPVECGCALVRDGELLRRTFAYVPPYLHTEDGVGVGGPDFAQYGFQQTRGFRALKLWMVLRQLGRRGLVELIDRHLKLAAELTELVDATPYLQRVAPTTLSVIAFRYIPPGDQPVSDEWLSQLNRQIEARVQTDGRVFLTSTHLREGLVLRACILNYATESADLAELVEVIGELGAELAPSGHDQALAPASAVEPARALL
ncbi:MAG: aspartate aminotransferase family protein [Jatrophihabitantaceae bacterium]